jgi:hypothetical protein
MPRRPHFFAVSERSIRFRTRRHFPCSKGRELRHACSSFGGGHLLRPAPVPGKQLCRQRINLGARDETRPDAALPQHPHKRAPDRARCRANDDQQQCLFDGIHASTGNNLVSGLS